MLKVIKAKLLDSSKIYSLYFRIFSQTYLHGTLINDLPQRSIGKISTVKAIMIHLFHLISGRLENTCRSGNFLYIFSDKLDMTTYKIEYNNTLVGFCFITKINSRVWEIGIIGISKSLRGKGLGIKTISLLKKYAKNVGVERLVVRSSGLRKVSPFFNKCGFKKAYSEIVFEKDVN